MSAKDANNSGQLLASEQSAGSLDTLLREVARVSEPSPSRTRTLPVGTALAGGRMAILRRVGEGGMGVVYEAFDGERKQRVALKTLSDLDAAGVYRLKNEFRALAGVTHPNLVQLHELFVDADAWFFTMELVDGERFDTWVRPDGVLDESRLRAALPQLVAAIGAVHGAAKLHRDLKPSNVLVTSEGRIVVLDFGLAVDPELGGVGQTLVDERVSGTPAYMAPEQAAGRAATTASDFYALGAMLFEALTGRVPFSGRVGEILAAKQRDAAPDPRVLCPVPEDLADLCARLLSREPAARPDAAALRRAFGVVPTPAREASGTEARPAAPAALIGRAAELEALRDAFRATAAGKPVVLFVTGESGIGKSALVEAFLGELREQAAAVVLAGRCYERENVPYKGFDALVDELSRHLRKQPPLEAAALMPREVFALARIFPVLDRIAAVAHAPKRMIADPQDLKRRAFEAFAELLARIRDRTPLVVVVDDLQWLDQDSMRFMRALLLRPEPAPLLWLCAHRSEGSEAHALLQAVRGAARENSALELRTLALGPLAHAALVTVAEGLLPDALTVRAHEIAREAQGSPFFAAQLARAAPLRSQELRLADALSLHVASLPAEARELLSVLALAGQPVSPRVAIEAAGLSAGHVQLDRLRSEQLVRISFEGEGMRTVECYHDRIREQLVGQLDAPRLHAFALALSRVLLAEAGADPELLARLLEVAGASEQAAEHTAHAAARARTALAFTRAAELYTRALAQGRFEPARLQALRIARAEALAYAGQGERAGEAFVDAAETASKGDAHALICKAAEQYVACGDLERGNALHARALEQIGIWFPRSVIGTLISLVWSRVRLRLRGLRYSARAQHDRATLHELELLRNVTHCRVRTDLLHAADFSARWVLRALRAGHEVELARALALEFFFASILQASETRLATLRGLCRQLCEQTGDWMASYALAHVDGFQSSNARFDGDAALRHLDRALELLNASPQALMSSYDRAWIQYSRLFSLVTNFRFVEARELGLSALEDAVARGDHALSAMLTHLVSAMWVATGRPELAMDLIEQERHRLRPGTLPEFMWLLAQFVPDLYLGRVRDAWYAMAEQRERCLSSFARQTYPGEMECLICGVAVAASRQAESASERRSLERTAERLARKARRARPEIRCNARAAVACLHGDREAAIAALREAIATPAGRVVPVLAQRRLGELLGGDEGATLIAEADATLLANGVVEPARYVAAVLPGIELP